MPIGFNGLRNSLMQESNLKTSKLIFVCRCLNHYMQNGLLNCSFFLPLPARGKEVHCVIPRGWKKSEIVGLLDGSTFLPPEDPFHEMTQYI